MPLGLLPEERGVIGGGVGNLHLVKGDAGGDSPPEDLLHFGLLAAGTEHRHRPVVLGGWRVSGPEEERETV